jgi:transposase, IS5 family
MQPYSHPKNRAVIAMHSVASTATAGHAVQRVCRKRFWAAASRVEMPASSALMMATINAGLAQQGLILKTGTIVDATIIAAPSSTKNKDGERDPEMHQTKKGNAWHFGMKAHISVDAESGLVHTVIGTAANVNDVTQGAALLHGEEEVVFADAGYRGIDKRDDAKDLEVTWHVAM